MNHDQTKEIPEDQKYERMKRKMQESGVGTARQVTDSPANRHVPQFPQFVNRKEGIPLSCIRQRWSQTHNCSATKVSSVTGHYKWTVNNIL